MKNKQKIKDNLERILEALKKQEGNPKVKEIIRELSQELKENK